MAEGYYVTVLRDSRLRYARGPFPSHEDALAAVEPTRDLAQSIDPWTDFDAWGTTRYTAPTLPTGPMNHLFPEAYERLLARRAEEAAEAVARVRRGRKR